MASMTRRSARVRALTWVGAVVLTSHAIASSAHNEAPTAPRGRISLMETSSRIDYPTKGLIDDLPCCGTCPHDELFAYNPSAFDHDATSFLEMASQAQTHGLPGDPWEPLVMDDEGPCCKICGIESGKGFSFRYANDEETLKDQALKDSIPQPESFLELASSPPIFYNTPLGNRDQRAGDGGLRFRQQGGGRGGGQGGMRMSRQTPTISDIASTVSAATSELKDHVSSQSSNVLNSLNGMESSLSTSIDTSHGVLQNIIGKTRDNLHSGVEQTREYLGDKIDNSMSTVASHVEQKNMDLQRVLAERSDKVLQKTDDVYKVATDVEGMFKKLLSRVDPATKRIYTEPSVLYQPKCTLRKYYNNQGNRHCCLNCLPTGVYPANANYGTHQRMGTYVPEQPADYSGGGSAPKPHDSLAQFRQQQQLQAPFASAPQFMQQQQQQPNANAGMAALVNALSVAGSTSTIGAGGSSAVGTLATLLAALNPQPLANTQGASSDPLAASPSFRATDSSRASSQNEHSAEARRETQCEVNVQASSQIFSISPDTGPVQGGTTLAITGQNLAPNAQEIPAISVRGVPCGFISQTRHSSNGIAFDVITCVTGDSSRMGDGEGCVVLRFPSGPVYRAPRNFLYSTRD